MIEDGTDKIKNPTALIFLNRPTKMYIPGALKAPLQPKEKALTFSI